MRCPVWKSRTPRIRAPANRSALAAAYVFTRKPDKALPLLEQSVAAEPGNYDLRMMYARALRDKRQFQPAASQFYAAAKLKPSEPKPWTELGGMLYMAGDLPQALAAFEQAAKNGENVGGQLVPARHHSGQAAPV